MVEGRRLLGGSLSSEGIGLSLFLTSPSLYLSQQEAPRRHAYFDDPEAREMLRSLRSASTRLRLSS